MTRTAGREPDADLVDEVHRRTGGNPFFVEQTARLWHADDAVGTIAPGVREAVRRRLAQLPPPWSRRSPSPPCWAASSTVRSSRPARAAPVAQVDRLLDRAVTARLVVARGGGRFAFAHDLVRETLYDGLTRRRPAGPARRGRPGGRRPAGARRSADPGRPRPPRLPRRPRTRPRPGWPRCWSPPGGTRSPGWPPTRRRCTSAGRWRSSRTRPNACGSSSTSARAQYHHAGREEVRRTARRGRHAGSHARRPGVAGPRRADREPAPAGGDRSARSTRRSWCARRTGG